MDFFLVIVINTTSNNTFFIVEHQDIEEDEYEEFIDIAKELQVNEDMFFGIVTSKSVCNWFKSNKTIDRTPSVVVVGTDDSIKSINLNELYGDKTSLKDWIIKNSIPLVGKLTNQNFAMYEKLKIPMLLMVLL